MSPRDGSLSALAGDTVLRESAPLAPRTRRIPVKRTVLATSGLIALAIVGLYLWHWFILGRFFANSDDAFVAADTVSIAPRIPGVLAEVLVHDNQVVTAGQVLARIDARDCQAALALSDAAVAEAQAGIKAADAQTEQQRTLVAQADADIEVDQAQLHFAALEQQRAATLSSSGDGSRQARERTEAQMRQDVAALKHAEAGRDAATARNDAIRAEREFAVANLQKAQADRQRSALNLEHTVITAPIAGIVGDRSLRQGMYVQPGIGLLSIVPTGNALYVTANLKETQLDHLRPGEPVTITADAFGDHIFHGRVDGISPGTGAEFALLPPENATGNFTKIVQRIPIRIRFDTGDDRVAQLRAGLSVYVSIDTREPGRGL